MFYLNSKPLNCQFVTAHGDYLQVMHTPHIFNAPEKKGEASPYPPEPNRLTFLASLLRGLDSSAIFLITLDDVL